MTLEALVAHFGYAAIVVGAILEGETVLLVAAVFVQQGLLDFNGMLAASALGAFAGDQFFFHLGRRRGTGLLRRHPAWQRKLDNAVRLLERRRATVVLFYRFIYGMRAVIPFLLGSGRCPVWLFAVLSAVSAAAWAFLIGSGGYYFGEVFAAIFARSRHLQQGLFFGLVVILLIAAAWRWWVHRRPHRPNDRSGAS